MLGVIIALRLPADFIGWCQLATVFLIATRRAHEANPLMALLLKTFGPAGLALFKFTAKSSPFEGSTSFSVGTRGAPSQTFRFR